jgi:hypothetical protein
MDRLERIIAKGGSHFRTEILSQVSLKGSTLPIYAIHVGSTDLSKPVLGIIGGVHGLERVGTQLALSYLESLIEVLDWDAEMRDRLKECRIVAIPLLNPGGMSQGSRSNPNGVDLMRNSPTEAEVKPAFILGGHRISPRLPWYRGEAGLPMEIEAQALCEAVRKYLFESKACLVLDLHSGFGAVDRLWYPFAKTTATFPNLKEVDAIEKLLNRSNPHHVYHIESQSKSYTTHGDLWDFLYDEHRLKFADSRVFIPWTLEMGSWLWIRKNPTQLFSALGAFNPVKIHRYRRIMRRHVTLVDFFLRIVRNYRSWWASAPA